MTNVLTERAKQSFEEFYATVGKKDGDDFDPDSFRVTVTFFHVCYKSVITWFFSSNSE